MNKFIVFLLLILVTACNRKPFVAHKLQFTKVADDCSEQQTYFRLTSNFGGERYEFEKCLPADFNSKDMSTERRGDTVVVNFKPGSTGKKDVVYHITLDIDSYPEYGFLTIGEDTYQIAPSKK